MAASKASMSGRPTFAGVAETGKMRPSMPMSPTCLLAQATPSRPTAQEQRSVACRSMPPASPLCRYRFGGTAHAQIESRQTTGFPKHEQPSKNFALRPVISGLLQLLVDALECFRIRQRIHGGRMAHVQGHEELVQCAQISLL